MTPEEFAGNYQPLRELADGDVRSVLAIRTENQAVVMVHYFMGGPEHSNRSLLAAIDRLPDETRRRILDRFDVGRAPVVVTKVLFDFVSFEAWILSSATALAPLPAGESAAASADTLIIDRRKVGAELAADPSASPPPAPLPFGQPPREARAMPAFRTQSQGPPSPMAPAAGGDFTGIFGPSTASASSSPEDAAAKPTAESGSFTSMFGVHGPHPEAVPEGSRPMPGAGPFRAAEHPPSEPSSSRPARPPASAPASGGKSIGEFTRLLEAQGRPVPLPSVDALMSPPVAPPPTPPIAVPAPVERHRGVIDAQEPKPRARPLAQPAASDGRPRSASASGVFGAPADQVRSPSASPRQDRKPGEFTQMFSESPVAPSPPPASAPAAPAPSLSGSFTGMFARQPSAPEPAGGATNRPGLFTQMFSQMNLGDASMAAPGGQSPAAGSPMGSPDSLLGASRAPGTPPSVPPAKPVALGEFTRMFESTSPPAAPAPESVVGAPSPRPYLPPVAPTVRAVPDGPSQYTLSLQRIPLPAQPALPAAPAPEQTPTRPPARRLIALIVVGTILVLAAVLIFYTGRP